mmetsp:Transcript_76050/g.119784  ORF Transcript_76050/g.119784 Transcript_76050/m.119784 type:complete len:86 (-) Transcript_76050:1519-1776(-)
MLHCEEYHAYPSKASFQARCYTFDESFHLGLHVSTNSGAACAINAILRKSHYPDGSMQSLDFEMNISCIDSLYNSHTVTFKGLLA